MKKLIIACATVALLAACSDDLLGPEEAVYSRLDHGSFHTLTGGIALQFEFPSPVDRGDDVTLRMRIVNTNEDTVVLGQQAWTPYDFVATTTDSVVVWEHLYGLNLSDTQSIVRLGPGEEMVFSETWDQRDNGGNRVPSGSYLVRAVWFGDIMKRDDSYPLVRGNFWTEPIELVIR